MTRNIYSRMILMQCIMDSFHLLLWYWCMRTNSTGFSPWKLSTPEPVSATPGMLPRARNASPAKSLAVNTSWSITVKAIIAHGYLHCSNDTLNSKHSSNIGWRVFLWTFVCCSLQCGNIRWGRSSTMTNGSLKPFGSNGMMSLAWRTWKW